MSWLQEFHRRWQAVRGKRVTTSSRAFSVDWEKLLESAGVASAEDLSTATRELEAYEKSGHFTVKRHCYRKYLIERVSLPETAEAWLREQFQSRSSIDLQAASLEIVAEFAGRGHVRLANEWAALCELLRLSFLQGRSLRPFSWTSPARLRFLLETVKSLSEREWELGTPVRAASVQCGLESKMLERHQRTFESGLSRLFGASISFRSLGFVSGESHVELHGPLCLHFPDGSSHDFEGLTNVLISAADIARCCSISTTATCLLTIENRKTTFRQYAAANQVRRYLIATTSFPTPAFCELLEKLPLDLSHHHFGDTDPAGWHILLKLRQATTRPVVAYQMKWRPSSTLNALTSYDRDLLHKLLTSPLLEDVRAQISMMAERGDRGDYEQETLGPPPAGWLIP